MAAIKIMKRGEPTLIFPEGKRVAKGEKAQVNPGIIRLAIQANVPILPAYVTGNTVTYGEPIYYGDYAEQAQNADVMQSLTDELMEKIYSLGTVK